MPTRQKVNIPEGMSNLNGNCAYNICHYTDATTSKQWQSYLGMKKESHSEYTVLTKFGCVMPIMQDSEAEYKEHQWLWDNATGDVLIGGLGIGFVHQTLMDNPDVTSVTIIEKSQDVIDLVWEHCVKDDTFTLIKADIETWVPPEDSSWDVAWFDTWIYDNPLSMKEYKNLMHERYSTYITIIGSWWA
tara:strand:- start:8422 stop:8985 length:564 start_codon:yes stop_codon:yes gene_type:complete